MQDEVAYVLITVFVILPLVYLVYLLLTALGNGWALQSAILSLPFA